MIGRVVSAKLEKTVTVLVESQKTHPLYNKSFLRTKKYLVHDLLGAKLGQIVEFEKIRPISKRKHWQTKRILGIDVVALGTEALKKGAAEAIAEVLPEEEESVEGKVTSEEVEEVEAPVEVAPIKKKKTENKSKKGGKKEEEKI